MEILDGKVLANQIRDNLKLEIQKNSLKPGLAVILVGDNPGSKVYVNMKEKTCNNIGIKSFKYELNENTTEEKIINLIKQLNNNQEIHGILVQLPLPKHLNSNNILEHIKETKDVDGLTAVSLGNLKKNNESFSPCTPKGILTLLNHYNIPLKGKNVTIINHSNIVGKPLASLFLNNHATVTVCHEFTDNLVQHTKQADILISGVGKINFITEDMVKENAIIIDVGINKTETGIQGDVHENVKNKASYFTPVPGGVGPMTIAMLMMNTYNSFKRHNGIL
jgi:methylenetetrahydrofolate dehydrogenase (NADP+) / methenyltetrahydrofolate cyclohydrolase